MEEQAAPPAGKTRAAADETTARMRRAIKRHETIVATRPRSLSPYLPTTTHRTHDSPPPRPPPARVREKGPSRLKSDPSALSAAQAKGSSSPRALHAGEQRARHTFVSPRGRVAQRESRSGGTGRFGPSHLSRTRAKKSPPPARARARYSSSRDARRSIKGASGGSARTRTSSPSSSPSSSAPAAAATDRWWGAAAPKRPAPLAAAPRRRQQARQQP
jgi:hypothetical protein